ncbi:MAG TPA: helix-turn-helix transcriptional regulator, partial [Terriglobales bacterium]|nr:helix-turn-helix transcriptional regulator [Terriglobales bacterium]
MKRTQEDDDFAMRFGEQLWKSYNKAKKRGVSDEAFAGSIGVARAQLDRYLRGEAMPGVRTVVLALRRHRVCVPYNELDLSSVFKRGKKISQQSSDAQLTLPF